MTTDLAPAPLDPVERKRLTNARFGRKKRAKARAAKLCQNCPLGRRRSARPGKSTCEDCAARQRKAQRQSRRERLAAKLCVDCGLVPFTAGTLCADCDARRRARPSYGRNATRQRRREERLCRGGCGRSAYRTLCCAECTAIEAEKAQVRRAERIAQGLCYRCGRHPAPANKGCTTCVEGRRSKRDRRKTPRPMAERQCGGCGEIGHRRSSRQCPRWKRQAGDRQRTN